jgi:hypothetical protein
VKGEDVLQHELRRIVFAIVGVGLDIEADHVPALGEEPLGPSAKAAAQVDSNRPHPQTPLPSMKNGTPFTSETVRASRKAAVGLGVWGGQLK